MSGGLGEWEEPDDTPTEEPTRPAGKDQKRGEQPKLQFASVDVFVAKLLAPTYRRSLDGRARIWCPQWWRHAEAIIRLEALWRAWEHLRLDPATGMSVWLHDHADYHMGVLFHPDGPFKGCSVEKGHTKRLQPLPVEAPPQGLFTTT